MHNSLKGTVWRLSAFLIVCLFFTFAMFALFGELRFRSEATYRGIFSNTSGLEPNQFVRVAGVEVGKVKSLTVQPDNTVVVQFTASPSVPLTQGSRAVIRYDDLIGGRYLALQDGPGATTKLKPGDTIPLTQTSPALDLDALIGGFRPLFRALNPDQTNALTAQLIRALGGQGDTIENFFTQAAALTSKLADRDELIGNVIANLNVVLGSLADQNTQFAKAVDSLSTLVGTLAERKQQLAATVGNANDAAASIAGLLAEARPVVPKVISETDRTAGILVADHDYLDNLLATLPDAYQKLNRQAIYGDFFSFYLCDLVLKMNGKGGQPVYIKVAGQSSGRCAPR